MNEKDNYGWEPDWVNLQRFVNIIKMKMFLPLWLTSMTVKISDHHWIFNTLQNLL
jgi:hypothetical protein